MRSSAYDTVSAPLIQDFFRFFGKVEFADSGCWEWTGHRIPSGYGHFAGTRNGKRSYVVAARTVYSWLKGPIPDGLEIDHLCRNRGCVNPNHLEPVTHAENMRRSAVARTHCPHGHEYSEANLYYSPTGRECRICKRQRWLEWQKRQTPERLRNRRTANREDA